MRFALLNKLRDYDLVKKSGLFDSGFYLSAYPDVAQAGIDPVRHYLETGWKEGRNPSAGFDTTLYLKVNRDVEQAGLNPLVHYLKFGRQEGRRISVPELFQQYLGLQVEVQHEKNLVELFSLLDEEQASTPPRTQDEFDILVPVSGDLPALQKLLENIIRTTTGAYRLLIADGNSGQPGVTQYLADFKAVHPDLNIILINIPLKFSLLRTIDRLANFTRNHFAVLDVNCALPPNWLERLMHPILVDDTIASVTPFTNAGTFGGFPDVLDANPLCADISVEELDRYFRRVKSNTAHVEIPAALGYCVGINRDAYKRIGRFQQASSSLHAAQYNWSRRALRAGFRHVLAANLFVAQQHKEQSLNLQFRPERWDAKLNRFLYPDYLAKIDQFMRDDPLVHLRNALLITFLAHDNHTRLVFDHGVGGGANEYTRLKLVGDGINLIVSPDNSQQNYRVILAVKGLKTVAYRLLDQEDICNVVEKLNCRDVVINELVSYPDLAGFLDYLVELKKERPDLQYTYITHDYYSICPSFHLLDYTGKYCGIPEDLTYCDTCLSRNRLAQDGLTAFGDGAESGRMAAWREEFRSMLAVCDHITCFSNSSRELLLRAYPGLNTPVEVTPHEVGWMRKVMINKTSDRLNIAVIGYLTEIKGAAQVVELARYLQEKDINAAIHIFGPVIEPYNTQMDALSKVIQHYAYSKSDLPDLMEQHEIDLVFIASIVPETFSYTTQEAIEMGLPVAVFDLGAPAERVSQYPAGLVLTDDAPEYVYKAIQKRLTTIKSR